MMTLCSFYTGREYQMSTKRIAVLLIAAIMFGLSACNLQVATPVQGDMVATAVAQTMNAQTNVANLVAGTLAAMVTDTPIFTSTPSITPLPTLTPTLTASLTPAVPTVSVSGNTNCRTGPGSVYDLVGVLLVGKTAQVVGRDAYGQYWIINNPNIPGGTCWLWGQYATVTGDTSALPVIAAPPTPTPVPSFTFSYKSFGTGPGYECFMFTVKNTGALTWESFTITFTNSAHGTTATASSDEFTGYDQWCTNPSSQSDLMAGEAGTASVQTFLAYNPAGETFDVTLKLCSDNGLAGICVSKTISFSP